MNVNLIGNIAYQGPGGANVSQSLAAQATYTALQAGIIDIPSGAASGSAFQVPFAGVATAKGYFVKANTSVQLGINGGTGTTQMQGNATGGTVAALGPLPGRGSAVTGMVITIPLTASGDSSVEYVVWGD